MTADDHHLFFRLEQMIGDDPSDGSCRCVDDDFHDLCPLLFSCRFAWYPAIEGYNSTALVHSRSRSESSVTIALASQLSVPTSTVTSGCAPRLVYQSG